MSNESISSNSQTDWQRLDAMSDEDIDLSDCPEITPELFAKDGVIKRRSILYCEHIWKLIDSQ
ncbi:MAG: hypothetical protein RMZ43_029610 [Nostoc sp. CmiVER01]|uniref:hypothetical protein n=1 Tax=Nostoc sp. CmiVER01 TaxID=3075384 RepID=UPI002AD3D071|nr:hypothetical protein [Nostoc sp. CmiVER01]MDZ8121619.1 hypothetical protein [Nostoc sp. CmiVER01]